MRENISEDIIVNNDFNDQTILEPKVWLNNFLRVRNLTKPTGKRLYTYHVTKDEFEEMVLILRNYILKDDDKSIYLFAVYCLFISEYYRSHYTGADNFHLESTAFITKSGFMWNQKVYNRNLILLGLWEFWKNKDWNYFNNICLHPKGLFYLLCDEGGIPFNLNEQDFNIISENIEKNIRYSNIICNNKTFPSYLPNSIFYFYMYKEERGENLKNIFYVLAHDLRVLVYKHKLYIKINIDVIEYLDEVDLFWRHQFPNLLTDKNSQNLLEHWVILTCKTELIRYK